MAFENLRNQLKTDLEAISSIQEVADYPTEEFGGFPAAMIRSTRLEAEFETTKENRRVYVFTVYLLQEYESTGAGEARRIIEGVADAVIKAFDENQFLTGVSLPSAETMIICYPVLSEIYEDVERNYVIAEMDVRVVISVDIT